jgi:hypothetical protein
MPIASHIRADLAKVAQYLSVQTAQDQPQAELQLYFKKRMREVLSQEGDLDDSQRTDATRLSDLIRTAGASHRRQAGDDDPYKILAALKLPVYITTSWTSLLEDAIEEARGERPDIRTFGWHLTREDVYDEPEPTREKPLVYHLFGTFDDPDSLVITEDDYFAWLTQWIKRVDKDESIPGPVRDSLTNTSLMFLGYGLDDWEFRVLFQSIKSFEGSRLRRKVHIGVQVSPDSNLAIEPEATQEYLESYFGKEERVQVSIYWGTPGRFLKDLSKRMQRQSP